MEYWPTAAEMEAAAKAEIDAKAKPVGITLANRIRIALGMRPKYQPPVFLMDRLHSLSQDF